MLNLLKTKDLSTLTLETEDCRVLFLLVQAECAKLESARRIVADDSLKAHYLHELFILRRIYKYLERG